VDGSTRLEEAIAANGDSLQPVLVALNDLVTEGTNGKWVEEERLRSPNVQFAL
jgi:hypothetical protein